MRAFVLRATFGAAAALCAAALVDPIVERLSNAGAFGPGRFTDGSTADVLPALGFAGALAALVIVVFVVQALRPRSRLARFLGSASATLEGSNVARALPVIFGAQMLALFAMETLEQAFVLHHVFGGGVWLGAPAIASLAFHALGCIVVAFALARALRATTRRVVALVRVILARFERRDRRTPHVSRELGFERAGLSAPILHVLHERAPPILSA
jgi:hypothetical protein